MHSPRGGDSTNVVEEPHYRPVTIDHYGKFEPGSDPAQHTLEVWVREWAKRYPDGYRGPFIPEGLHKGVFDKEIWASFWDLMISNPDISEDSAIFQSSIRRAYRQRSYPDAAVFRKSVTRALRQLPLYHSRTTTQAHHPRSDPAWTKACEPTSRS